MGRLEGTRPNAADLCFPPTTVGRMQDFAGISIRANQLFFGNMSGQVDWGSYEFVRPLKGVFGIIDEVDETHGAEASITGVCLAPSVEGLLWTMRAAGFSQARVLPVPEDGYEQLKYGKRVMVAGMP